MASRACLDEALPRLHEAHEAQWTVVCHGGQREGLQGISAGLRCDEGPRSRHCCLRTQLREKTRRQVGRKPTVSGCNP